jgi:hypothetical protein
MRENSGRLLQLSYAAFLAYPAKNCALPLPN